MDKSPAALTYTYTGLTDSILTPIELFSDIYDDTTNDVRVAICDMFPGNEMIIGMDIISQMDFAITNGGGQTKFSIAIPPFDTRIDFSRRIS
jgi:hypothetical protein